MKKILYLVLFLILSYFLYSLIPGIVFFVFVPLFFYVSFEKKFNHIFFVLILILTSFFNFYSFMEFGTKYMAVMIFADSLFLLSFGYLTKIFIKKKYHIFTIPALFSIIYYLFSLSVFSNFWINLSGFLSYYPISMKFLGSSWNVFFVMLFNVIVFELISKFNFKQNKFVGISKWTYILFGFLILNFFVFNTYFFPSHPTTSNSIKIAGVQGDLNQDWLSRSVNSTRNYEHYINLSKQVIALDHPQIIVWPEYTFTNLLDVNTALKDKISNFSKKNNVTMIVGSILLQNLSSSHSKRYDTLYIFQDKNISFYRSINPVTLLDGSTIPARNDSKINISNAVLGLNLCFEENFPSLFSNYVKKEDANVFVISGNVYYIKNSRGQNLMALNSNLRAVENNRYLIRVDNGGITKVVDNNGRVLRQITFSKPGFVYYNIPLINQRDFYSMHQNLIEISVFIFSLIIIYLSLNSESTSKKSKKTLKKSKKNKSKS